MSTVGIVHLVFSLLALVMGGVVMVLPKGTRWHRTWGHGYAWCMAGIVVTSFAMFGLTGSVTPFHLAALIAALTLAGGMGTVLARRPRKHWIHAHARFMAWSYVGLAAALVAESLTRFVMPLLADTLASYSLWPAFWALVAVGSFGVFGLGGLLIRARLDAAVRSVPGSVRREREALGEAAG